MQNKMKRCLEDQTPVEFTATVDDTNRFYSLVVNCDLELTEEEYALCLISFAEDILEHRFSFKTADSTETVSQ